MFRQAHAQKEIAAFSSAYTRFALASQPDALPLVNAARNFDLIAFYFVRTGAAQRNCPRRSVQRFLQRNHDIGFYIGAAFRRGLASPESAESRSSAAATEKRFEEIAESCPAKFELDTTAVAAPSVKSAFR